VPVDPRTEPPFGEREVMALLLTTNAELVAGVLRGVTSGSKGGPAASVLAAVTATNSLQRLVGDILHALVRQARAEGHTWSQIGELLGTSRQAAFQRFGGPPREEGEPMKALPDADEKAVAILDHLMHKRWDRVRADFDERMKLACSADLLASVLARAEGRLGPHRAIGSPSVALREGHTVVDVPLAFARGEVTGRVTFNGNARIAGLFFLAPETESLPEEA
jgi:hypothetical protein